MWKRFDPVNFVLNKHVFKIDLEFKNIPRPQGRLPWKLYSILGGQSPRWKLQSNSKNKWLKNLSKNQYQYFFDHHTLPSYRTFLNLVLQWSCLLTNFRLLSQSFQVSIKILNGSTHFFNHFDVFFYDMQPMNNESLNDGLRMNGTEWNDDGRGVDSLRIREIWCGK